MINKIFIKAKQIFMDNFKFIIFIIAFYFIANFPLPYYIYTTGGLIDLSDKVTIEGSKEKDSSINLSYVTEMKGTIITYLGSYLIPGWDKVPAADNKASNETYAEVDKRNYIMLNEANDNAIMVAYSMANKEVTLIDEHIYITFIADTAKTDLKIGDDILKVNDQKISSMDEYRAIINAAKIGDSVKVLVKDNKNKIVTKKAVVYSYQKRNITGVILTPKYSYKLNPKATFNFNKNESGPSGGLMMSIAIYNKLVPQDITHGMKIAGTGTIDLNGNVGEISGIKYKIKGAVKEHANIFFAPAGANYKEAYKIKKENNYNIKIISVNTFKEALDYLDSVFK